MGGVADKGVKSGGPGKQPLMVGSIGKLADGMVGAYDRLVPIVPPTSVEDDGVVPSAVAVDEVRTKVAAYRAKGTDRPQDIGNLAETSRKPAGKGRNPQVLRRLEGERTRGACDSELVMERQWALQNGADEGDVPAAAVWMEVGQQDARVMRGKHGKARVGIWWSLGVEGESSGSPPSQSKGVRREPFLATHALKTDMAIFALK